MPTPINFQITDAGLALAVSLAGQGLDVNLTHAQVGSGNRTPDGTETALINAQLAVALAGGAKPTPTQLTLSAIFTGAGNFPISEIGIWAGDPAQPGSTLFAYYAVASGSFAFKYPGVDFIFSYDMTLGNAAPHNIQITIDTNASVALALMNAHTADPDAHPQYEKTARFRSGEVTITQPPNTGHARNYAARPVVLPTPYLDDQYQVVCEVLDAAPFRGAEGSILVNSRSTNGFTLAMTGSATSATVRWKAIANTTP